MIFSIYTPHIVHSSTTPTLPLLYLYILYIIYIIYSYKLSLKLHYRPIFFIFFLHLTALKTSHTTSRYLILMGFEHYSSQPSRSFDLYKHDQLRIDEIAALF